MKDQPKDGVGEDATQYKRALFSMVPMACRIKFAETTHQLDDADYKYSQLVQYLSLQEAIEKNARGKKRPHEGSGSSGGCGRGPGRGRGGHGSGRGYYGRGNSSGRGFYGRGYGYGGYPSLPAPAYGGSQTTNPYIAAARGGRFLLALLLVRELLVLQDELGFRLLEAAVILLRESPFLPAIVRLDVVLLHSLSSWWKDSIIRIIIGKMLLLQIKDPMIITIKTVVTCIMTMDKYAEQEMYYQQGKTT